MSGWLCTRASKSSFNLVSCCIFWNEAHDVHCVHLCFGKINAPDSFPIRSVFPPVNDMGMALQIGSAPSVTTIHCNFRCWNYPHFQCILHVFSDVSGPDHHQLFHPARIFVFGLILPRFAFVIMMAQPLAMVLQLLKTGRRKTGNPASNS